ncbi:glycosyltransferase, partial [bacterium]|nr:glycosyltransferase [bacterium]
MNKERLTIGLFNDSFYPMTDGVITVVDNYARRLSKYANVIVFAPKYFHKKFDDSQLPYKVVRCHSIKVPRLDYSLPLPKLDRKYSSTLKKYNLDIIHIHSPFAIGRTGLKYAVRHNIPCIATMHTQFKQDIKKYFKFEKVVNRYNKHLIKFFNKCDECWAVNKEVARIYHEEYKYKCMPRVMNNATEMLLTDKDEAFKHINSLYNIKPDEKVFLFVGRINTLKNILFIADSLAKVKELMPDLKFKMLYVGSGRDERKLKDKISKLNLEKDVILCGKISDRKLLAQHY